MDKNRIDDSEEKVDEGVEETFPASDAPATGGTTGPNDLGNGKSLGDGKTGSAGI